MYIFTHNLRLRSLLVRSKLRRMNPKRLNKKTVSDFFSLYSLPFLSGLLMGISYIPFPPWTVFFCFIPLWVFALKHQSISTLLKGGWICQFTTTIIGFSWVIYSIKEIVFSSWISSLLAFLFFCSFANLHIPIALVMWLFSKKLFGNTKKATFHSFILLLLPLYSALSMEYYPMIFKWHFGYVWLYAKWPAFQTAEIWGFQFLNTLTLFFNLFFLFLFQNLKQDIQIIKALIKQSYKNFFTKLKKINLYRFCLKTQVLTEEKRPKSPNRISILPLIKPTFNIKKQMIPIQPENSGSYRREKTKKTKPDQYKLNIPFYRLLYFLKQQKIVFIALCSWAVLFILLNLYGQHLKQKWPDSDKKATVLIIQPNIANEKQGEKKWSEFILSKVLQETTKHLWTGSDTTGSMIINKYKRQSIPNQISDKTNLSKISSSKDEHSIPVDFILWPEGAYPYPVYKSKIINKTDPIQKWAAVFNTPLIASAKGKTALNQSTNSIFVFDQKGYLIQNPYDKTILMPFGEYIPLEKWFPFLGNLFFDEETFTPGTGRHTVIHLNTFHLGFQICYESLFDGFTRDLVLKGADILINVTNDSWFGRWQEPWQHLYMTAARAIEFRRPLIRGTNSGFSAVVSAKGDISSPWSLNKNLGWIESVPYLKEKKRYSFFTLWGYYLNQFFLWTFWTLIHCLFLYQQTLKKSDENG